MLDRLSRREFLHETAATTAIVAAASALPNNAAGAAAVSDFASRWDQTPDRVWLGAEYWANPLQDWRIAGGRIECIKAAPNRNVHLLTRQLGEQPGDLQMSVRIGRVGGGKISDGKGSAGFRIGVMGPLREYRNSLIYGQGLDAGFRAGGRLFIDNQGSGVPVELTVDAIELRLAVQPHGNESVVTLSAHSADGKELARVSRENVASADLVGNVALVANFGGGANAAGKAGQKAKGKKKAADVAADRAAGEFWFADWTLSGSRVQRHDERAFGPILFSQYTLSGGTLKLTAQMPPLGLKDSQMVRLQLQRGGDWRTVGEEQIHPESRT